VRVPSQVLRHHSKVLASALDVEGQNGTIFMPGVSKQTLLDLVQCFRLCSLPTAIVTGCTRMVNLLIVASKYQIDPLVDACTFLISAALTSKNVPALLAIADQHQLSGLLRAAIRFATRSERALRRVKNSDEFETFSADLLRLLGAYQSSRRPVEDKLPPFLQWAVLPNEFPNGTNWSELSNDKDSLRRACFERGLEASGSKTDLVKALNTTVEVEAQDEENHYEDRDDVSTAASSEDFEQLRAPNTHVAAARKRQSQKQGWLSCFPIR